MRKTVMEPVTYVWCDAHLKRDGSEVVASGALSIGDARYDLCVEHEAVFARYLFDALGVPAVESTPVDTEDDLEETDAAEPDAPSRDWGKRQLADLINWSDAPRHFYFGGPASGPIDQDGPMVYVDWNQSRNGRNELVNAETGGIVAELHSRSHVWAADAPQPVETAPESAETETRQSVMICGEIPGYTWETAREAVRSAGFGVVGRADETTVLLILGDGGDRNSHKLRDAQKRGIPCMDARQPGRFRDAVCAGRFEGTDPLPEPAKKDAPALREQRAAEANEGQAIREWARENGYKVSSRGRIPMHVTWAYKAAHAA